MELRTLAKSVLRIVFPETCAGCGISGSWMCRRCAQALPHIDQTLACPVCGQPDQPSGELCRECASVIEPKLWSRSAFKFDGSARRSIHLLKYQGERQRSEWAAEQMIQILIDYFGAAEMIVPVPLGPGRLRSRGYNQALEIARRLGSRVDLPVVEGLERVRDTLPQVGLSASDRFRNVTDAFEATMPFDGESILLIDDVMTTGATLHACAATCLDAGAGQICSLTLARGQ